MPEHAHVLLLPPDGAAIGRILYSLKKPVSNRAVAHVRRTRPSFLARMADVQPSGKVTHRFWQRGGGYDWNVWTAEEAIRRAEPALRRQSGPPRAGRWAGGLAVVELAGVGVRDRSANSAGGARPTAGDVIGVERV